MVSLSGETSERIEGTEQTDNDKTEGVDLPTGTVAGQVTSTTAAPDVTIPDDNLRAALEVALVRVQGTLLRNLS